MVIAASGWWRQCLIVLVLALIVPSAWAQSCPPSRAPVLLRMETELPRPDYRHLLSRARIGALGKQGYMSSDTTHAGLTQAETAFRVSPKLSVVPVANGMACLQLDGIEASWRMTKLQVDIAADYNRATCAYAEIWRHETQHVTFSQKHFMIADKALRTGLEAEIQAFRPVVVSAAGAQRAADAFQKRLEAVAAPILQEYGRNLERDNRSIDTPESYQAVSARCKDW